MLSQKEVPGYTCPSGRVPGEKLLKEKCAWLGSARQGLIAPGTHVGRDFSQHRDSEAPFVDRGWGYHEVKKLSRES